MKEEHQPPIQGIDPRKHQLQEFIGSSAQSKNKKKEFTLRTI